MEEISYQHLSANAVQPPCSPDLNPLNFYLLGNLKSVMYLDPIENEDTLQKELLMSVKLF
jgi:hypothetical protein